MPRVILVWTIKVFGSLLVWAKLSKGRGGVWGESVRYSTGRDQSVVLTNQHTLPLPSHPSRKRKTEEEEDEERRRNKHSNNDKR